MRDRLNDEYFEWLIDLTCKDRFASDISYRKLLTHLHEIEFTYSISKDQNRAKDGIDLRYRFALTQGYEHSYGYVMDCLEGPCSVLEMMVALSIRCEEFMDDPDIGDRTKQWFWGMLGSLGIGYMNDSRFDEQIVDDAVITFLNREYEPDGRGGLFTIYNCPTDLRDVEIWYQLCWYLDTVM